MKVFKFNCGQYYYVYSACTEQEAKEKLIEDFNPVMIGRVEEIPEEMWDEKIITVYEDNDLSKEPFKLSIRESIYEDGCGLMYTNDLTY